MLLPSYWANLLRGISSVPNSSAKLISVKRRVIDGHLLDKNMGVRGAIFHKSLYRRARLKTGDLGTLHSSNYKSIIVWGRFKNFPNVTATTFQTSRHHDDVQWCCSGNGKLDQFHKHLSYGGRLLIGAAPCYRNAS